MSIFNHHRLDNQTFKLDIERMCKGWYTDKYFVNVAVILNALSQEGYTFKGDTSRLPAGISPDGIVNGDIEVEMQWFTRRPGSTIIVGVDKALTMLKHCTGYWKNDQFVNTHDQLEVWAVQDGCKTFYNGNPLAVQPVLKSTRPLPRFRHFGNAHPRHLGACQPGGNQCVSNPGGCQ